MLRNVFHTKISKHNLESLDISKNDAFSCNLFFSFQLIPVILFSWHLFFVLLTARDSGGKSTAGWKGNSFGDFIFYI